MFTSKCGQDQQKDEIYDANAELKEIAGGEWSREKKFYNHNNNKEADGR